MEKAKKVFTMHGQYSDEVEYEYRGKTYCVEYSKCWTYCVTPAWVQHRDAQARIDEEIERESKPHTGKPVDLDEIWELMGWEE